MREILTNDSQEYYFDSWLDFVNFATDVRDDQKYCSSHRTGNDKWYGTKNFKEAENFARNGWTKGRKKIKEMRHRIDQIVSDRVIQQQEIYDTGGAFVDVGRYCEGVPECMVQFQEQESMNPQGNVISIDVTVYISAGIHSDSIMRRGAVIASLCDALEAAGKRVEISISTSYEADDKYTLQAVIKQADQPLDIDTLSFALVNPSTLRRLVFSAQEKAHTPERIGVPGGYGGLAKKVEGADINLSEPWLSGGAHKCFKSNEAAAQWLYNQLENQGIQLESAGA